MFVSYRESNLHQVSNMEDLYFEGHEMNHEFF
jgi:hypothetical protein